MFFYPGTPCIYYGDEIGLTGNDDPECRKCMEWNKEKQNQSVFNHVKKLIEIRKNYGVFVYGDLQILHSDDTKNTIIFTRTSTKSKAIIIINNNDKELDISELNEVTSGEEKDRLDLITGATCTSVIPAFGCQVFLRNFEPSGL